MGLDEKRPHILEAVALMKERGVTAIKIELEAQMDRGEGYDWYCEHCEDGYYRCYDCEDGWYHCNDCRYNEDGERISCEFEGCENGNIRCENNCDDGYLTCGECDGDYHREATDFGSNDECMRYILKKIGLPEDEANDHYGDWTYGCRREGDDPDSEPYLPWLQFARFYNDGSVDSELTFTVRLDDPENIFRILDVTNAFIGISDEVGGRMDTHGAGIHTSLIFDENYNYPVRNNTISSTKLGNFSLAMKQLLPALYFLSTHNERTRSLHYRAPNISFGESKYSAIHYTGGALEFRVFDTCYDNPEDLFDNIVVVANCSRFLTDRYTGPQLYRKKRNFYFGSDDNDNLNRLFATEEHLDILTNGLKHIKPSYYTVKELKKQRKFVLDRGKLRKIEAEAKENAKRAYEEYSDRFSFTMLYKEDELRARHLRNFLERHNIDELRAMSEKDIREAVELQVLQSMDQERAQRQDEQPFIANELRKFTERVRGRYQITLA